MLLKIDLLGYDVPNSEMSYGNFFIRYKHKFLRNIYSDFEITESPQICTLQIQYILYQKFIKICVQCDKDLKDFLQEKSPETDLEELRLKIDSVEIKEIIKSTNGNKVPRFNLKL